MKDTNGKPITEEEFMKDIGHGTSPQPENWEIEFEKRFTVGNSIDVPKQKVKDFIKEEIRKAEERKDKHYHVEIEKIIEEYNQCQSIRDSGILEDLEALKK